MLHSRLEYWGYIGMCVSHYSISSTLLHFFSNYSIPTSRSQKTEIELGGGKYTRTDENRRIDEHTITQRDHDRSLPGVYSAPSLHFQTVFCAFLVL